MLFSKTVEGFLLEKMAAGRSAKTLEQYRYVLDRFKVFVGDVDTRSLKADDVRRFLAWLRTDYEPQRFGGDPRPVSDKTVLNFYSSLSSFWSWLVSEDLADHNVVRTLPTPKFSIPIIEPFTQEEIGAILKSCDYSREWTTSAGNTARAQRPTARRDRAIVLVLLDTGLRASELCHLLRKDADLESGLVIVRKGKGRIDRAVYAGRGTRRALWRYLAEREDGRADDFLFLNQQGRPFTTNYLRLLVKRLGERVGVEGVHPHRFRHTFAIQYLRNGGDVFTLQKLLGHASLTMVRRYLRIVRDDVEKAHRRASPADNWRL